MRKLVTIILILAVGYFVFSKYTSYQAERKAAQQRILAEEKAKKKKVKYNAQQPVSQEAEAEPIVITDATPEQKLELFEKASTSQTKEVIAILDKHINPNFTISSAEIANYPLFISTVKGSLAKYMRPNTDGWTLMFIAVASGNEPLAKYLVEKNADINVTGPNGQDLMETALLAARVNTVKLLADKGLKIEINPADKNNPLTRALTNRNYELAKFLYNYAQKNQIDISAILPNFKQAISNGDMSTINFLTQTIGLDYNTPLKDGVMPIHLAAATANDGLVQEMAIKGADINAKDANGRTTIYYAIGQKKNNKTIGYLLQSGALVNMQDAKGVTPLMLAIAKKDIAAANIFINNYSADVNATADDGNTALQMAVQTSNYEMTKKLIEAGAKVNVQTKAGATPLITAAKRGNYNIAKLLVQNGASNKYKDKQGKTAAQHAVERGYVNLFDLLEKAK
ncbi:ankyrin repeat protein [Elusimicrobium simillimum]|uniref:ankyrin repeat domain-containing protein n=1 Tax=Elusimicrobium simillimum TaxID=3143438 RepID=UPI003C6EAA1B